MTAVDWGFTPPWTRGHGGDTDVDDRIGIRAGYLVREGVFIAGEISKMGDVLRVISPVNAGYVMTHRTYR